MIPLVIALDDLDFDGLVEIARSRLPVLAPEWTDYNYSDPGITLVELLCWVADSQIYSLARNRHDERAAMGALLGIEARGAKAATGTLFADPETVATGKIAVAKDARLVPVGAAAPRLEVSEDVTLHPVAIEAIRVTADGSTIDRTAANVDPIAIFPPFGSPPSREAVLAVRLRGPLAKGDVVSLGLELERDAIDDQDRLGGVAIFQAVGARETPVEAVADTSDGFRRSGLLLIPVAEAPAGDLVEFRFRALTDALMPHLLRISVNALPVVQRATLKQLRFIGTGRPGQRVIVDVPAQFPADEPGLDRAWTLTRDPGALRIRVAEQENSSDWERGSLADADGEARVYEVTEDPDGNGIGLRFGNGVNGRRPPLDAELLVSAEVTAGAAGNVRTSLQWLLDGHATHWRNREPIEGGEDADGIDDVLRRLRVRLRDERTLATSAQIVDAARALSPAYQIRRATIEEGWEPGRRRPAAPATRTLLVTRDPEGSETADWLNAIRAEISPRIPLAERLVVAVPRWRPFGVRIRAVAAPRRIPGEIERAIRKCLLAKLPPGDGAETPWPLGRDVTADEVGGWVRGVDGIASLVEATLLDERGSPLDDRRVPVGRGSLPRLGTEAVDVQVGAGGGR